MIKWVQFLQCPPQKFVTAKKSSKICRDFLQLSTLIAYISGSTYQKYTLEIDQGLLAHTRRGGGQGSPKQKSWKLKICLKIQHSRVHNFRNSGSIFTKLFHATCHYCERNFVFLKLIWHSDLRRRAASRLALPCTSSFTIFYRAQHSVARYMLCQFRSSVRPSPGA